MLQPTRALDQRLIAGLILRIIGNRVPCVISAKNPIPVDADHPIAGFPQPGDGLLPSMRIIPIFALRRALRRDADIGLGNWPSTRCDAHHGRIVDMLDPEDMSGHVPCADRGDFFGRTRKVTQVDRDVIDARQRIVISKKRNIGIGAAE